LGGSGEAILLDGPHTGTTIIAPRPQHTTNNIHAFGALISTVANAHEKYHQFLIGIY